MAQKTTSYRPTPTNPTTVEPRPTSSAIEDLDDFMDEIDDILQQEEEFAVNYRQRGGQ
jgi:ubiquitin-like protein Pup